MTKTQNNNVLVGMRCPRCKQVDRFSIRILHVHEMVDSSKDCYRDVELEDDAPCRCPKCNWQGTVKETRALTEDEHKRLVEVFIHLCHSDFRYLHEVIEMHVENNFDLRTYQKFKEDFAANHVVETPEPLRTGDVNPEISDELRSLREKGSADTIIISTASSSDSIDVDDLEPNEVRVRPVEMFCCYDDSTWEDVKFVEIPEDTPENLIEEIAKKKAIEQFDDDNLVFTGVYQVPADWSTWPQKGNKEDKD